MVSKGLLQEIDHGKVSFKNIDKNLLNKVYDKGNKYSIPKDYGVAGVVYDPVAVGGTIKTWQDFFDAGAKPGVSGKVQMAASAYDVIGPGVWLATGSNNFQNNRLMTGSADIFAGHQQTGSITPAGSGVSQHNILDYTAWRSAVDPSAALTARSSSSRLNGGSTSSANGYCP